MENSGKLTPEQIENWRKMLVATFGTYALLMTDEQIQAYKDRMQAEIYKIGKEVKKGALE